MNVIVIHSIPRSGTRNNLGFVPGTELFIKAIPAW